MFITGQEPPDAALSATPLTGGMEAVKPLWFTWCSHGLGNWPLNLWVCHCARVANATYRGLAKFYKAIILDYLT